MSESLVLSETINSSIDMPGWRFLQCSLKRSFRFCLYLQSRQPIVGGVCIDLMCRCFSHSPEKLLPQLSKGQVNCRRYSSHLGWNIALFRLYRRGCHTDRLWLATSWVWSPVVGTRIGGSSTVRERTISSIRSWVESWDSWPKLWLSYLLQLSQWISLDIPRWTQLRIHRSVEDEKITLQLVSYR